MADRRPAHDAVAPLDALGDQQRAAMVTQTLANIQRQAFELDVNQAANSLQNDGRLGDDPRTIGERRDGLQRAERSLREKFSDLMPLVERLIDQSNQ